MVWGSRPLRIDGFARSRVDKRPVDFATFLAESIATFRVPPRVIATSVFPSLQKARTAAKAGGGRSERFTKCISLRRRYRRGSVCSACIESPGTPDPSGRSRRRVRPLPRGDLQPLSLDPDGQRKWPRISGIPARRIPSRKIQRRLPHLGRVRQGLAEL
jgi:hypothetical protein